MRGNPVQRVGVVQVVAVLRTLRRLFCPSGLAADYSPAAHRNSQTLPYCSILAQLLGNDVSGKTQGPIFAFDLIRNELCCRLSRRVLPELPHSQRQRLQSQFLCHSGPGPSFRPVGKVHIFQSAGLQTVLYRFFQGLCKSARFRDGLEYGLLPFLHLVEELDVMLELRYRGVVQTSGFLLAITAYERNGVSLLEHLHTILHLPGAKPHQRSYMLDI